MVRANLPFLGKVDPKTSGCGHNLATKEEKHVSRR